MTKDNESPFNYAVWRNHPSYNAEEVTALLLNIDPGDITPEWLYHNTNVICRFDDIRDEFTETWEQVQHAVETGALKPIDTTQPRDLRFTYAAVKTWLVESKRWGSYPFFDVCNLGEEAVPSPRRPGDEAKEHDTLLKIIYVLCQAQNFDFKAKGAAGRLQILCDRHGVKLSENTLLKYLRKIEAP